MIRFSADEQRQLEELLVECREPIRGSWKSVAVPKSLLEKLIVAARKTK